MKKGENEKKGKRHCFYDVVVSLSIVNSSPLLLVPSFSVFVQNVLIDLL